ncbi:hypothetical protein BGX34_012197 [Mortierella sp. NVP85]|nr:hypothetical protein BGX34_012197 [Mortierella sp. NVP85]
MSTTVPKADHPASSIHAGLTLLCEDPRRGVGPTLTAMLNADTHTGSEAARTLGESLLSIINLANSESAKSAFGIDRFPIPSSLADKSQQRLEWYILATLVPVLTIPQSDNYRDLVFNALLAIRYALAYSEEGFLFETTSWPMQRAKGFDNAVLGILNDICEFLKSKTLSFPASCHIKMNAFKGGPTAEADPTWVTLNFHALDSTITVIRCLLGILCPENDSSGGLVDPLDDDQQVHQMEHILTVLDIFLPNGVIAKKEWKGDRPLAADSTSVTQLYQECCQCILKTIPLRRAGCSLYSSLAKSLMIILYHHVMTVEDRCKDWSSGSTSRPSLSKVKIEGVSSSTKDPVTTAMSVRECRKEIQSIGALEDLLTKSLTLIMESCFSLFPDTVELREVLYLVVDLLLSKQLLLLSHDNSGIHVQASRSI